MSCYCQPITNNNYNIVRCGIHHVSPLRSIHVRKNKGRRAGENHDNSLASRPIHTNNRQCSSSAWCVRLVYSLSCAQTLMTEDRALPLPRMYDMLIFINLLFGPSVGAPFCRHESNHYERSAVPLKLRQNSESNHYERSAVPLKLR